MKKIVLSLLIALSCLRLFSQVPQKISYQSVVRDIENNLVKNTEIGLKISLLKGSLDGNTVYYESQTPETNMNGLISIEFGSGLGFDTINWSEGPYFIKTEIDLSGGTNYNITGICQLLSVPYALHSISADFLTNTEIRKQVGDLYGGGIIFYVDQTGQHGLICSLTDQASSQVWSNVTPSIIGPASQSDWDGQTNTIAIIGQAGHQNSAAKLCDDYINLDYGTGIFSDWYLPAINQCQLIFQSLFIINKTLDSDNIESTVRIVKEGYWSSTEDTGGAAYAFDFRYSSSGPPSKESPYRVRAIRSF